MKKIIIGFATILWCWATIMALDSKMLSLDTFLDWFIVVTPFVTLLAIGMMAIFKTK